MGGGCWVLGGEFWVVMNCCDGRWRVGEDFSLWFFWIMKGWWSLRKGGIITAYIRVFFIIKLLSLLTFRVTLLGVNGLDKIIGWQIWQESRFWFFACWGLLVLLQGVLLLRGGLFLFCFLIFSAFPCLLCLWTVNGRFVPPYIL